MIGGIQGMGGQVVPGQNGPPVRGAQDHPRQVPAEEEGNPLGHAVGSRLLKHQHVPDLQPP